ncbi:MAG: radical SAM protein [Spirochaetaceae bacterium]|jgi:uncharacterized protein|nr:radical SAM protein [Spirochaetaceae bacterium]
MQSMKESKFNYAVYEKDYVLLYNHLTNRIVRIHDKAALKAICEALKAGETPAETPLFKRLKAQDFVIDSSVDEDLRGRERFLSHVYNPELRVIILASEQCNFRCTYCYESFKRGALQPKILEGFIKFLRKNLGNYTGLHIDWFGGEPLLAPDAIERLSQAARELCRKSGKTFRASITTNGYLLDYALFRMLSACNVVYYQITIDGLATTHDKSRVLVNGEPTFERIINNLRCIRDTVKSRLFTICIRSNISQIQLPTFNEYIDFLQREFGGDNRFNFLFRPAGNWGGERVKSIEDTLLKSTDPIYEALLKAQAKLDLYTHLEVMGTPTCYAGQKNGFVLGSDGTLYKCTVDFEEEYNHVGYMNEKGDLVLDNDKFNRWLALYSERNGQCSGCTTWSLCHNRICAAQTLRKSSAHSGNCGYEKSALDDFLRVLDCSQKAYVQDYEAEGL